MPAATGEPAATGAPGAPADPDATPNRTVDGSARTEILPGRTRTNATWAGIGSADPGGLATLLEVCDRYQAVVFDFFGTLTRAVIRGPRHVRVARVLGCDPVAFMVMLDRTYRARVRGELGDARSWLGLIAELLGRSPSPDQLTEAAQVRFEGVRADVTLRADAEQTLWTLRAQGIRTAVVSDCTEELPAILPSLPIAPLLDATVFSCELGAGKPDPVMFTTASRTLGVHPQRCLYVGDGGGRELSGARATGMTAVRLVAPDLAAHLSFDAEPEWDGPSVASLSDVPGLVATRADGSFAASA